MKLVEVTQFSLVNEKPKEKEMEDSLKVYEMFLGFFLERTQTKL